MLTARQTCSDKGLTKYGANGRGIAPVFPRKPCHFKLAGSPQYHLRGREQWIIIAPEFFIFEIGHPRHHNLPHVLTHRPKEEGVEGLTEFRLHLPCILMDAIGDQVDMLQLH